MAIPDPEMCFFRIERGFFPLPGGDGGGIPVSGGGFVGAAQNRFCVQGEQGNAAVRLLFPQVRKETVKFFPGVQSGRRQSVYGGSPVRCGDGQGVVGGDLHGGMPAGEIAAVG